MCSGDCPVTTVHYYLNYVTLKDRDLREHIWTLLAKNVEENGYGGLTKEHLPALRSALEKSFVECGQFVARTSPGPGPGPRGQGFPAVDMDIGLSASMRWNHHLHGNYPPLPESAINPGAISLHSHRTREPFNLKERFTTYSVYEEEVEWLDMLCDFLEHLAQAFRLF